MLSSRANEYDVSIVQTRLLGVLRDREPTMKELSQLLDLDKSSTTGLIDRAERRGFVRRTVSSSDKREIRVSITPRGRKLVNQVATNVRSDLALATSTLTPTERHTLSRLATRVFFSGFNA
jgi:MarR family transcriptional regulator, lower aerobic nicotinate degradation pathway regulator